MADVLKGRGAFTPVGKDNHSPLYEYIAGLPQDGSTPNLNDNYRAVAYGVRAYQLRLNELGASAAIGIPSFSGNGYYGPLTTQGVAWAQKYLNTGLTSGKAGTTFSRYVWKGTVRTAATNAVVPARHLYGIMIQESGGDPGAVGYTTPDDLGLFQINMLAHGPGTRDGISPAKAHDPNFAAAWTASRLHSARRKYDGKGTTLKNACSIAQHNSPVWADEWFATGTAPNDTIAGYVEKVLNYGLML